MSIVGSRTKLSLAAFHTSSDYLQASLGEERGAGATLTATRRLSSASSIDFVGSYLNYDRKLGIAIPSTPSESRSRDIQLVLRGNRTLGTRVSASLEIGQLRRSGSQEYQGWWVGLRSRWLPVSR